MISYKFVFTHKRWNKVKMHASEQGAFADLPQISRLYCDLFSAAKMGSFSMPAKATFP